MFVRIMNIATNPTVLFAVVGFGALYVTGAFTSGPKMVNELFSVFDKITDALS